MGCGASSEGGGGQDTITVSSSGKKRDAYKLVLLGDKAVGKSRCVAARCGVLLCLPGGARSLCSACHAKAARGAQRLPARARPAIRDPRGARRVVNAIPASPPLTAPLPITLARLLVLCVQLPCTRSYRPLFYRPLSASIVLRYTQDKFQDAHALTIGAAFVSKDLSIVSSSRGKNMVRLHIWDTAGEEVSFYLFVPLFLLLLPQFLLTIGLAPAPVHIVHIVDPNLKAYRSMTRFFYREAEIGIVVYDVTNKLSFQHLDSWVNDFKEQCPDADVIIAGNKCDIPAQGRQVSLAEAEQFAADRGFVHIECSAKANINVQNLFGKVGITLFRKTFPGETDAEIQA